MYEIASSSRPAVAPLKRGRNNEYGSGKMKKILCVLFVMGLSATAYATIINIPTDNSTIQQGIDASSDGDTVLVAGGVISLSERINYESQLALTPGEKSPIALNIVSEIEPNNTCDSAQAIECGDTVWCATMADGQDNNDWYIFTITSARLVTIATHATSGVCEPAMTNTYLHLWTGDCQTWLAFDDDSGPGFFSLISIPLTAGTYAINSENYWDNTGSYHLSLDCDNAIYMNGLPTGSARASQCDVVYPFQAGVVDDFTLTGTDSINIGMAVVWFDHWNGNFNGPADYTGLNLYIYEDNYGTPAGEPVDLDPHCLHIETIPDGIAYKKLLLPGAFSFWRDFIGWRLTIPIKVRLAAGVTYWLEVQPIMSYADAGQSGWVNTDIVSGYYAQQIFAMLGTYPYTTMEDSIDMAFYLVEGDSAITGTSDNILSSPYRFILQQNYPNPFNAQTTIRFVLPELQYVTLIIYDLLGRQIQILLDEQKQAGVHTVTFDASGLSSGVYFAKLETNNATESIRMLLLR
jgi:hypothetical protein